MEALTIVIFRPWPGINGPDGQSFSAISPPLPARGTDKLVDARRAEPQVITILSSRRSWMRLKRIALVKHRNRTSKPRPTYGGAAVCPWPCLYTRLRSPLSSFHPVRDSHHNCYTVVGRESCSCQSNQPFVVPKNPRGAAVPLPNCSLNRFKSSQGAHHNSSFPLQGHSINSINCFFFCASRHNSFAGVSTISPFERVFYSTTTSTAPKLFFFIRYSDLSPPP